MMPFDGERLTRSMRARNVDVVLATSRHNVRYLTGGYYLSFYARASRFGAGQYLSVVGIPAERPASAFYVGRQDAILNEQDYIEAFGPLWITDRHWIQRGPSMSSAAAEAAAQVLRRRGLAGSTIGIESSFLPADAFDTLRRALPEASFADATPILADLRAVKRPDELERLRQVHQMTAEAIRAVLAEGRPEETTRQIAARAQRRIEEPHCRVVEGESSRGRLLEHAFPDEVREHAVKRIGIAPRRGGQTIDLADACLDVLGNPQRRGDVHAPRRAQIAQGFEIRGLLL